MRQFRRVKRREKQADPAQTSERESKLSGTRPMHIDPDDDRPTREDVEKEKAAGRSGVAAGPGMFG
jgi:hypothetical protein